MDRNNNGRLCLGILILKCCLAIVLLGGCAKRQEQKILELRERIAELTSETIAMKIRVNDYLEDQIRLDLRFMNRAGDVVGEAYGIVIDGRELIVEYLMVPLAIGRRQGPPQYLALPYRIYTDAHAPADGYRVLPHFFDIEKDTAPRIFEDGTESLGENHLREVRRLIEPVLGDVETSRDIIFVNERKPSGGWSLQEGHVYNVVSRVTGTIEILEDL